MIQWPLPNNIKALRRFLGLTGYYRNFFKDYSSIAVPLIALLRKNVFCWTASATEAFLRLKEALTTPSVLRLPDFTKQFTIECDACGMKGGPSLSLAKL